ncbi:MAG: sulfurtransferase TusA family protein [Nitrospiraceae bacterium]|jgi:tRNA 2-thiouridine synthesizing protein A|nr:MAG: sulfurtransferase TusA family protein [Nitrospiraceae bacterium]
MADIKVDLLLDTKGMICPLPVIKTKKAIDTLQSGQVLEVTATDPRSKSDIPAFLKRLGHELLKANEERGAVTFYIRKK